MKCVYCNQAETRVMETREAGVDLRRRRECTSCGQRFTTYERVEVQPIRVIKKDGARELFDRDKFKKGILLACERRPVTEPQIQQLVTDVEHDIRKSGDAEIGSKKLGQLAMERLKKLDKVSYIRFASVYKQFASLRGFEKEIQILTRGK